MSLHPEPVGGISAETARVARVAFPKGGAGLKVPPAKAGRPAEIPGLFNADILVGWMARGWLKRAVSGTGVIWRYVGPLSRRVVLMPSTLLSLFSQVARAVQRCRFAVTESALQHLMVEMWRLIARGIPEPAVV